MSLLVVYLMAAVFDGFRCEGVKEKFRGNSNKFRLPNYLPQKKVDEIYVTYIESGGSKQSIGKSTSNLGDGEVNFLNDSKTTEMPTFVSNRMGDRNELASKDCPLSFSLSESAKIIFFFYLDKLLGTGSTKVPIPFGVRPAEKYQQRNFFESEVRPRRCRDFAKQILSQDWNSLVKSRLDEFFRKNFRPDDLFLLEGRGRRRDQRMLALIVMGFMIMASILIPTGFQFLTVLGGKSLLMAKMALIMSAISGLKKIATSNVGYGFYHTGTEGHHHDHLHHGFHEKLYQGPNVQQSAHYSRNLERI